MNNFKSIIQSHNNFILSKYNEMTTQKISNKNKHVYIGKNDNINYIDSIHEINISLDKNDNSILNNRNISKPNVKNNDNTNHTYKNKNRPVTRSINKSLIKSTKTIVPNDPCSKNNNNHNNNNIANNNNDNNNSNSSNNNNNNKEIEPSFKTKNKENKNCNCRKSNKVNCKLQGNCLIINIVYKVR